MKKLSGTFLAFIMTILAAIGVNAQSLIVNQAPITGDNPLLLPIIIVVVVCALVVAALLILKKRKK